MREIQCPACARALSMPEEMVGKQVRCPLCSHVFQVAGPGEAVPQPAAPPAPARPDYGEPAPSRRPPGRGSDYDDYGRDGYDAYNPYAAGARGGAALWLLVSGILDLLVLIAFYVFLFTVERRPPPPQALIIITMLAVVFYVAPLVFVFIAAAVVRHTRGTGMVITGSVMAFVLAVEQLLLAGIFFIVLIEMVNRHIRSDRGPAGVALVMILSLAALALSIVAGIRALMAISSPGPRRRDDYYQRD